MEQVKRTHRIALKAVVTSGGIRSVDKALKTKYEARYVMTCITNLCARVCAHGAGSNRNI